MRHINICEVYLRQCLKRKLLLSEHHMKCDEMWTHENVIFTSQKWNQIIFYLKNEYKQWFKCHLKKLIKKQ